MVLARYSINNIFFYIEAAFLLHLYSNVFFIEWTKKQITELRLLNVEFHKLAKENSYNYSLMGPNNKWEEELSLLKSILLSIGLTETIKWGTEVYTHRGKNVVAVVGLKNYFSLWFYNGVFLKDKYKVLVSAKGGNTKALKHWQFTTKADINEKIIKEYIKEAVKNEDEGRVWKPQKSEAVEMPELLVATLKKNKTMKAAFEKLTPGKQREYMEHINSAKREETKKERLEKMTPMILAGLGLNDKYKK